MTAKEHALDCESIEWGHDGPEGDSGQPCNCYLNVLALKDPEPTVEQLTEAYVAWKEFGEKAHEVLESIWHSITPGDTDHMTYGLDPAAVQVAFETGVAQLRERLTAGLALLDPDYLADHKQSKLNPERCLECSNRWPCPPIRMHAALTGETTNV